MTGKISAAAAALTAAVLLTACGQSVQSGTAASVVSPYGDSASSAASGASDTEKASWTSGSKLTVSGTSVTMGDSYTVNAYGSQVPVTDVDFTDYGFGITLPSDLFNPDKLYYIQPDTDGTLNIRADDSKKTLLNFMDDTRFTLLNYSYGMFSTWASSYDDTTYQNMKRCKPEDLVPLVTEEGYIGYEDGYRIAKYYDNYESDSYRIEMEVDVYPFKGNTSFRYHGYLTMLCHNGIMRSILFAEPDYDASEPYQLIYPVSRSSYMLDVGTDWDNQPQSASANEVTDGAAKGIGKYAENGNVSQGTVSDGADASSENSAVYSGTAGTAAESAGSYGSGNAAGVSGTAQTPEAPSVTGSSAAGGTQNQAAGTGDSGKKLFGN